MAIRDAQPAEKYEDLKKQFFALRRLVLSLEERCSCYHNIIERFNFLRIISLEAELASEREMNAILTEELEKDEKI